MKELSAIFWVLVILVGSFMLYKTLPAYWGDYKLGRMMEEQAVVYTYAPKTDQDISKSIAEKAHDLGVELTPEEVKVDRTAAELSITATYSVHVDLPVHPIDMTFTTKTRNKNVMK